VILSCFLQRPAQSFINAAKQCSVDNLCGSLDAIAWGKEPFNGTSGPFEIMHVGKVCKRATRVTHAQYFRDILQRTPESDNDSFSRGLMSIQPLHQYLRTAL